MFPHDNRCSRSLTNTLAWVCSIMLWGACLCYNNNLQVDQSVHQRHMSLVCSRISSSCILKCKHTILAISTLKNIFVLIYPFACLNARLWYIPTCYLKELLMLTNATILAISKCGTLRPLGILCRPLANRAHDTKYHKWCSNSQKLNMSLTS